jgi:hypothetical protein
MGKLQTLAEDESVTPVFSSPHLKLENHHELACHCVDESYLLVLSSRRIRLFYLAFLLSLYNVCMVIMISTCVLVSQTQSLLPVFWFSKRGLPSSFNLVTTLPPSLASLGISKNSTLCTALRLALLHLILVLGLSYAIHPSPILIHGFALPLACSSSLALLARILPPTGITRRLFPASDLIPGSGRCMVSLEVSSSPLSNPARFGPNN